MPRSMWSGSISFGLVQIPVGVVTAEKSSEKSLSFTLLDKRDMSPIGYRQVNKNTGEEVPKDERVKGYEVGKNEYVIVEEDDFKRANVKATETIDIHAFVELERIPILRFEKPYYLEPQKKGLKAYALLREALEETGKVAVATIVMRGRQYLCAIFPYEDTLVLEMLRYDHELKEPEAHDLPKVTEAEVKMAETLIEGMTRDDFDTSDIKDTYYEDLLKLIEARKDNPEEGRAPVPKSKAAAKGTPASDIMELLKASVAKHKGGAAANEDEEQGKPAGSKRKAAAHRRPAKKTSTRAKRNG
jgi:DNA end-binding protein Ku